VDFTEAQQLYGDEYYCFQQDGAPSHIANIVQRWSEDNLTDFIPKDEWPSSSPDLNPLDFSIWGYMLGQLRNYSSDLCGIERWCLWVIRDIPEVIVRLLIF
jgi:hypothetical protein